MIVQAYIPTFFEVAFVLGGVFIVFIFGFLIVRFTKYGGGGDYGLGDGDNDLNDGDLLWFILGNLIPLILHKPKQVFLGSLRKFYKI